MNQLISFQTGDITDHCTGVLPLRARLEPWMSHWLTGHQLSRLLTKHGSPLNIHSTNPFRRNIDDLNRVASVRNIDFRVYFARKANKCLTFVQEARDAGCGVDVASPEEFDQVLSCDVDPARIICTAAIKEAPLLQRCIEAGVVVAIDNDDEIQLFSERIADPDREISVALRIAGFEHLGTSLPSRFGFPIGDVNEIASSLKKSNPALRLAGLHFHLDGYASEHRSAALTQLVPLVDQLRAAGHPIDFIDMGGGFPMSYLNSETEWTDYWKALHAALLDQSEPLTFGNDGFGIIAGEERLHGHANVYPAYQHLVKSDWLAAVLDTPTDDGTLSDSLRNRRIELRCEPGRSLLDGCGMTLARVVFRKRHTHGASLVGLAMNRTQCRTSHAEFMADPILVPATIDQSRREAFEGYLVGAYCMESDFIFRRRLRFPHGIRNGDIIAIPNTAGYLMHFVESRSHQFPLAKNFFIQSGPETEPVIDPIDVSPV